MNRTKSGAGPASNRRVPCSVASGQGAVVALPPPGIGAAGSAGTVPPAAVPVSFPVSAEPAEDGAVPVVVAGTRFRSTKVSERSTPNTTAAMIATATTARTIHMLACELRVSGALGPSARCGVGPGGKSYKGDVGPFAGEGDRDGPSDAAVGPGDQCHPTLQPSRAEPGLLALVGSRAHCTETAWGASASLPGTVAWGAHSSLFLIAPAGGLPPSARWPDTGRHPVAPGDRSAAFSAGSLSSCCLIRLVLA